MSAGELSDYSVCVVLQIQDGDIYVLDVLRERLEYPDLRRKVIDGHRRWSSLARNFALLIEDKGSGMSLIQDLRQAGIRAIKVEPGEGKNPPDECAYREDRSWLRTSSASRFMAGRIPP